MRGGTILLEPRPDLETSSRASIYPIRWIEAIFEPSSVLPPSLQMVVSAILSQ